MDQKLIDILQHFNELHGKITVITGAGISAESSIPTFRGKEGYWSVGAREYHPQEMATFQMYRECPYQVWQWYLYRKGVCNRAAPNAGHLALAQLEKMLENRFCLITQNVDGLHLRAGNTPKHTYQIHGNIDFMRCSRDCSVDLIPIPEKVTAKDKETPLSQEDKQLLVCPRCNAPARPHVLWFDEYYDEKLFRFQSSIDKARETDLLVVIGTSGTTNLPMQVGEIAVRKNAAIIDINLQKNPFTNMAQSVPNGYFYQGSSGDILPEMVEFLK